MLEERPEQYCTLLWIGGLFHKRCEGLESKIGSRTLCNNSALGKNRLGHLKKAFDINYCLFTYSDNIKLIITTSCTPFNS